jgi:hypothetical protein
MLLSTLSLACINVTSDPKCKPVLLLYQALGTILK